LNSPALDAPSSAWIDHSNIFGILIKNSPYCTFIVCYMS
jgi:hypothetical protein